MVRRERFFITPDVQHRSNRAIGAVVGACRCGGHIPSPRFVILEPTPLETNVTSFEVRAIGRVESSLTDLESAPRQADEGAPEAWLVFEPGMREGLRSLRPGDEVIVVTWLDRARRDVLSVHPRGDTSRPQEGVFSTRSPHRPNPLGLHRVEITAIDGPRVRVRQLEALDGTPIVDVKPVLSGDVSQR